MKICHFCGNKNFKKVTVQYTYELNEKFLLVDDVPSTQCEYCGEQYFEGSILKQIEKEFNSIYVDGKKVKKELVVPVESFCEFQQ